MLFSAVRDFTIYHYSFFFFLCLRAACLLNKQVGFFHFPPEMLLQTWVGERLLKPAFYYRMFILGCFLPVCLKPRHQSKSTLFLFKSISVLGYFNPLPWSLHASIVSACWPNDHMATSLGKLQTRG